MAIALLGKCVALLGLVVLLYATCYGFRIRDVTPHSVACVPAHDRVCPDKTAATGKSVYSVRKWHESTTSQIADGDRKPPAESTLGVGTEKIRTTERPRDKDAIKLISKNFRTKNVETDDDEDVEAKKEIEEDEGSEEDRSDEDDEEEERASKLSDQDVESKDKEKTIISEDGDNESADDEDDNDVEVKTKMIKYSKNKAVEKEDDEDDDEDDDDDDEDDDDDDDDDEEEEEEEEGDDDDDEDDDDDNNDDDEEEKERPIVKTDRQKVREPFKKQDKIQVLQSDEDKDDKDKARHKDDIRESVPSSKKLEKVRFADKDKTNILLSKHDVEKSKHEDKRSTNVTKPAVESVKKTTESTKKFESIESTKKPIESAKRSIEVMQKSVEGAKKLSETTKKLNQKAPSEPKAEVSKTATKVVDERSKTRVKPETSTPAPRIKEQAKQLEKADVKKVTAKVTSKPSREVSQVEKRETKPTTTRERTDASVILSELNDAILRVPTFVPNFTNVENLECQQHGKIFLRQLRGYKLWALQMLDSSAKISSGLLRGNVNQLGDYDQCLGVLAYVKVDERPIKIQGKYCLATVDMQASHPDMRLPVNLMQGRAFIRASMHDPGHFIPKFTTVNWALCLPAACSAKDAERALESALEDYNETVGIRFTVDVDPNMCYVKQKSQTYSKETIGVLYFYAMIVCLVIVATVRDYFVETQGKGNYSERIIMSFSLRRTIKSLLKEATGGADITCIHGIRALATIALYVAHQLVTIARIPFSNRTSLTELANNPASSILRVSLVYTDAFLLLSGLLTAYNMARELKNRGEIRWFCRFIARFIRLSPALLAMVFWYAFVMEHVGSGPQWNSIITANAELCKQNAWTNLLYVQNFFPFEEMCATHTHQLALDMQLSLLAPILVFFLLYKPLIGVLLIAFLVLLSATLRYIATTNNYLSLVIFHGMSLRRLYKTANFTYALPLHRATPYVFGVSLGVLLHYTGKNVKIHKVLVILGWSIATFLGSWSLFSPWRQARRDYVYNVEEAAHYAVIGPVLWAIALCWSIFACFTEHGGVINRFLSNYWLVIFSRISYAMYLTQFAVFFYNVGTTRFSSEFQPHRAIDPLEVVIVIVVSVILTLLFDLPMQEVKNVIMESTDISTLEVSQEEKTSVSEDKNLIEVAEAAKSTIEANVFEDDEIASTGWDWQKDIARGPAVLEGHETEEETVDVPILKKVNGRKMSFIDNETHDPEKVSSRDKIPARKLSRETEDYTERSKRDINSQRYATDDSEKEAIEFRRSQREHETAQRNRRSLSRTKDNKKLTPRESESEDERQRRRESDDDSRQFERPESRGRTKEPDDRSWEFVGKEGSSAKEQYETISRQTKAPLARRILSSESEGESSTREGTQSERVPSFETKTSDEEDWEHELRIRRKQFMEQLITQQRESLSEERNESDAEPLKRRSSAEGKLALLRDDLSGEDNMDSWTVSVGARMTPLGSSQEPSEPEDEGIYMRRREYREKGPPSREESLSEEESSQDTSRRQSYTSGSQKTSLEEEEDVNNYNFVLTEGSKRESVQDLSNLSQEELTNAGWNVVKKEDELLKPTSTGLFKRESIVKSQASEEDPEYFLPERPKLVQQEREHPFKKAWQVQKSRSEEEGTSAYAIKNPKEQSSETKQTTKETSIKREHSGEHSGEQSEDAESFADEEAAVILRGRSTDTEDTRTSSKSGTDETDSISTEYSKDRDHRDGDYRQSSKSETDEDSGKFNWPGEEEEEEEEEDEIYRTDNRSKSEEADWEREET
ncbi:LOW QUALITY PROTEIN: uncharacterized protein LOC114933095 [Nylanderia fulva]|uniref:LOW QUALITY PROTEIN: uncharacterized protein LOC114933095 n=1 Tax=Nylanderia fulva TaxID=613905 RepID=UPI0010FB2C8E|nr:LOW QUALITY PROTEIN: uncharacterized protein LOC114933095 [Nylanderia fulva]